MTLRGLFGRRSKDSLRQATAAIAHATETVRDTASRTEASITAAAEDVTAAVDGVGAAVAAAAAAAEKAAASADRAMSSADEVGKAAREVTAAAQAVASAVAHLPTAKPPELSGRRLWRAITLGCLSLATAVTAAVMVPAGFDDPAPDAVFFGNLDVVLRDGQDAAKGPIDLSVPLAVNGSYSTDSDRVSYDLWIPKRFAGWQFAVLLEGAAVVHDISINPEMTFTSQFTDCWASTSGPEGTTDSFGWFDSCQLVRGVVPLGRSRTRPYSPCKESGGADQYAIISIGGRSIANEKLDWAHRLTGLPKLDGTLQPGQPVSAFYGQPLDGEYAPLIQEGCKSLETDQEWKLTYLSEEPSETSRYIRHEITWDGKLGGPDIAVVSSRRDSAAIGNVLIIVAGVFASVAIGLIPIVYQEWGTWRTYRRSSRRTKIG